LIKVGAERHASPVISCRKKPISNCNPSATICACLVHCFTQLAEAADQIVATTTFRPG
jgi:hypothetical protein